jgi:hypothetical protein
LLRRKKNDQRKVFKENLWSLEGKKMFKVEKKNLEFRLSRYGLKIEYKRMPYFNLTFNWKKPDLVTQGITNRCSDGKYVLFLDYDQVYLSTVLEDIQTIRKRFKLCNFFIFKSSGLKSSLSDVYANWFVYSIDKLDYFTMKQILRNVRVDEAYNKGDYYHNAFVLRFSPKYYFRGKDFFVYKEQPKFFGLKLFKSCKYRHSRAHLNALKILFGLKVPSFKNLDNSKQVEIVTYPTMIK